MKKKPDKEECKKLIQECESILEKLDQLRAKYDSFPPEVKKQVDEQVAEKLSEITEEEWN